MYTKELEQEKQTQTVLLEELSELTGILKDTTLGIHSTVKLQNEVRISTCYGFLIVVHFYSQYFVATYHHARVCPAKRRRISTTKEKGKIEFHIGSTII